MSANEHKHIDLALLTQYTINGVIPIKNGLDSVSGRVERMEGFLFTSTSYTLLAENWEQDAESELYYYDLTETYPSDEYDIDVYLDDDNASILQREAFADAILYGGSNNIIWCGNTDKVPTIDIPIILKVVTKDADST